MNRINNLLLCLIFIFSLLAVIVLGAEAEKQAKETGSEAFTTGFSFMIREYEGKVAVFDCSKNTPIEILDCPISSLPEDEAAMLRRGISVASKTELQEIIEAFD